MGGKDAITELNAQYVKYFSIVAMKQHNQSNMERKIEMALIESFIIPLKLPKPGLHLRNYLQHS